MRGVVYCLVVLLNLLIAVQTLGQNAGFMTPNFKNQKKYAVYFVSWGVYQRGYYVSSIPIDYVQEILYGFASLQIGSSRQYEVVLGDPYADTQMQFNTGGYAPFAGNFGEFYKLKAKGKKFNLILSIGGWTSSGHFSDAVLTSQSRDAFTTSIVNLLVKYPIFSGVNFDWEYMSNDGKNWGNSGNAARVGDGDRFVQMLQLLRAKLRQRNMGYVLLQYSALAIPTQFRWPAKAVADNVDELYLMTYEFATSQFGDKITTHHTNLWPSKIAGTKWSVHQSVLAYEKLGVPSTKIMIGSAWYSRGFANSLSLNTPGSGIVPDYSWDAGIADYKSLPRAGATEYWDSTSSAGYSYDLKRRVFLSYDNVPSVAAKSQYVYDKNLRGVFAWAIDQDKPITNSRSILKTMYDRFVRNIIFKNWPRHSWPSPP